jgi:hypothetical protein
MALTDHKVKEADFTAKDIESLSDRPSADGMSAQALKERFDMGAKKVVTPKINALIDELVSELGASGIGITPIDGLSGYNVQNVLIAIKLLLDTKKPTEIADKEIEAKFDKTEAQSLVKDVTFDETTGIFTVTRYDGSKHTIDTAIEKVALNVRLEGQQFVLTLADGTEQRVDLSAFLTQTEVKSSDTITLSIEDGAIIARIATGSVKLAHLNSEVTAYIDAKEKSAADSASAAKVSETNAKNSADEAEESYRAALECQQNACNCASRASISELNASTYENNASQSADKAEQSAEEAKAAAEEAKAAAGGNYLREEVYDPQGKKQDIFEYVDNAVGNIEVDVTADIPMHFSINANGGLRITYDDGSDA